VVAAAAGNDGAFALDGQMVDRPIVERARAVLRQAR
jgi:citrate lyase beta subunit